jgi:hypothetical protein
MMAVAFTLGLGIGFHVREPSNMAQLAAPHVQAAMTVAQLPASHSVVPQLPAVLCAAWAKLRRVSTKEDFIMLLDVGSAAFQRAGRPFRFIEVGANDGVGFSDRVMGFVDRYAWTGVLLEPAPVHFRALRKAYGKLVAKGRQLVFLNNAISQDGAPLVIYSAGPLHLLPKWARGVFSTDRAHVQSHLDTYLRKLPLAQAAQLRTKVSITGERVEATTFAHVRRQHNVPSLVEYLQIDVEGLDLDMLHAFDLHRHGALFLQYEWAHLGPERTSQAIEYVRQAGYEAVVTGGDVVAVNERWLREGCGVAPTTTSY